ncbi:hypothetical protein GCM10009837_11430 [Streptomyces durmitorensis]
MAHCRDVSVADGEGGGLGVGGVEGVDVGAGEDEVGGGQGGSVQVGGGSVKAASFPNPAPSRKPAGAGALVAVITGFAEFVLKRRTG